MEWQPIETAEKGIDLLVWAGAECFVAFKNGYGEWQYACFEDDSLRTVPIICEPTHWAPLPEPPK